MNTALIRNPREWAESVGYFRLSKDDHARLQLLIHESHEYLRARNLTPDPGDQRILRKLRAAERRTKR